MSLILLIMIGAYRDQRLHGIIPLSCKPKAGPLTLVEVLRISYSPHRGLLSGSALSTPVCFNPPVLERWGT